MERRTWGKGCAALQLLPAHTPQMVQSTGECQCCGYSPWHPPEKSTHTQRHLHNIVFLLSLKQAIHLEVNGKKAPHIPVATRLPTDFDMCFKTRGSFLTSLFLSLFFFSFRLLFDFCNIEPKMHSMSLNLSAHKGPEKTVRVRHWKEPHSFKLQVGGMTE